MTDAESLEAALGRAGVGPVSRETQGRLLTFVELLRRWQSIKNLVAPASMAEVWSRHVGDSAQLLTIAPTARRWLDLGSGAGFPGMVVAILLAEIPGAAVHLVESDRRKAAFLQEAARVTSAPATVWPKRIESLSPDQFGALDAISCRAVASLDVLCGLLEPLMKQGARAYLHKGRDFAVEREEASLRWTLDLVEHESRFVPGVVAEIRSISHRSL